MTSIYPDLHPLLLVTIGSPNRLQGIIDHFAERMHFNSQQKPHFYRFLEKKYQRPIEQMTMAHFIKISKVKHLVIHDYHDKEVPITEALQIIKLNHSYNFLTRQLGHNRILHSAQVIKTIEQFIT